MQSACHPLVLFSNPDVHNYFWGLPQWFALPSTTIFPACAQNYFSCLSLFPTNTSSSHENITCVLKILDLETLCSWLASWWHWMKPWWGRWRVSTVRVRIGGSIRWAVSHGHSKNFTFGSLSSKKSHIQKSWGPHRHCENSLHSVYPKPSESSAFGWPQLETRPVDCLWYMWLGKC